MTPLRVALDTPREYQHVPFYLAQKLNLHPDELRLELIHPTAAETALGLLVAEKVDVAVATLGEVFTAAGRGERVCGVGRVSSGMAALVVPQTATNQALTLCDTTSMTIGVRRWADRPLMTAYIRELWMSGFCAPPAAPVTLQPADGNIAASMVAGKLSAVCLWDAGPLLAGMAALGRPMHAWGSAQCATLPFGERVFAVRGTAAAPPGPALVRALSALADNLRIVAERARARPSLLTWAWEDSTQPAERAMLEAAAAGIVWERGFAPSALRAVADFLEARELPFPAGPRLPWLDPATELPY